MQRPLNIEQLVMVKDRHRLNRLKKGKDANEKQYQALFEQSHLKVLERIERIPNIKLNQDLPVTQYAPGTQILQNVAPTSSWYVPLVQGRHEPRPVMGA